MLLDYKDAKRAPKNFKDQIFDLGDGEIDFPGCHRVLKSIGYKGWLCVDLDTARQGPRVELRTLRGIRGQHARTDLRLAATHITHPKRAPVPAIPR